MHWIRDIALFMVFSGILLELISDTKYYKFAKWVAGTILLLQFIKPFATEENLSGFFSFRFSSLDYAMGTDRVLEEIYQTEENTGNSVLSAYKADVSEQIDRLLGNNGLKLVQAELSVEEDGTLSAMQVVAVYKDKPEGINPVPTVAPVVIGEVIKKNTVSPMELYIREVLAEFYRMEENKIEVIIQEAR